MSTKVNPVETVDRPRLVRLVGAGRTGCADAGKRISTADVCVVAEFNALRMAGRSRPADIHETTLSETACSHAVRWADTTRLPCSHLPLDSSRGGDEPSTPWSSARLRLTAPATECPTHTKNLVPPCLVAKRPSHPSARSHAVSAYGTEAPDSGFCCSLDHSLRGLYHELRLHPKSHDRNVGIVEVRES